MIGSIFFATGSKIAGMKCTVLRDDLFDEILASMDMRTKPTEQEKATYNVVVAKSKTALIILRAAPNVPGGKLHEKAHKMSEYLKKCNM
ncbi:hypothetical protein GJAV_G00200120 [Gymnothorax javanicus]|nr:hypothetical protein GJAV_G00200120 [Gymnothorax javanicus]